MLAKVKAVVLEMAQFIMANKRKCLILMASSIIVTLFICKCCSQMEKYMNKGHLAYFVYSCVDNIEDPAAKREAFEEIERRVHEDFTTDCITEYIIDLKDIYKFIRKIISSLPPEQQKEWEQDSEQPNLKKRYHQQNSDSFVDRSNGY